LTSAGPASAAIREAVDLLIEPGEVTELRAIKTKRGTVSGYFSDMDALVRVALAVNQTDTVYVMPNPINPALLARANNAVKPYAKETTSDDDIVRRRWLLTDYDPFRPSGISSTDAQHDQAIVRADKVQQFLVAEGFSADSLVLIDSGNGAHLLAWIDEPNNAATRDLIAACLEAIKFRFADDDVLVDTTVSNAARIWKLPGTVARKGDSMPDRPHRLARVLRAPSTLQIASTDLLKRIASKVPADESQGRDVFNNPGRGFEIAAWIRDHNVKIAREGEWKGGRRWVLAVCPFDPAHTDDSAFIVQYPGGVLGAGCHHDHCQGRGWRELRALFEPDAYGRQNGHPAGAANAPATVAMPATVEQPWPDPLSERAFHGLVGDIVRAIEPHSEADPAALLAHALSGIGAMVDRSVYAIAGDAEHPAKLNTVIVGVTSNEPPRELWRLYSLRGESHGKTQSVLSRGPRAGGPDGIRATERVFVRMGDDPVDRREVRSEARDPKAMGAPGAD